MRDYVSYTSLAANPEAWGSTGRAAAVAAALGERVIVVSDSNAASQRTLKAAEDHPLAKPEKVRRAYGDRSIEYSGGGSIRLLVGGVRAGSSFTMLLYDNGV